MISGAGIIPRLFHIMKKIIVILFLIGAGLRTADAGVLFKLTRVKIDWRSTYDDNILRYSERDIDRFVHSSEPYPSKMSAYDDWKNNFTLKIYIDGPRFFRHRPDIWYFVKFSHYYRNPFKNYSTHTLILKQKVIRPLELHFKYFFMPDYYLREYRDRDTGEAQSCAFNDHQARIGFTIKLTKNLKATMQAEYEQLYYNKYFTEYDSESWLYELKLEQRVGRSLRFSMGYGFKTADNIGFNQAQALYPDMTGEFMEDTEYGDSSYEADIYFTELRYRVRDFVLNEDLWLKLQYKLRKRYYTTNNRLETDPFHAGRHDDRSRWIISATQDLNKLMEIGIEYTYESRDTESYYQPVIDAKNFSQNLLAFYLTYRIY